ncbi:MAG: hypothetical protein HY698_09315 [Deltaproteobacteria bacterium]|nr:hypothetical protein [Deltaproteobacteria bacterium]
MPRTRAILLVSGGGLVTLSAAVLLGLLAPATAGRSASRGSGTEVESLYQQIDDLRSELTRLDRKQDSALAKTIQGPSSPDLNAEEARESSNEAAAPQAPQPTPQEKVEEVALRLDDRIATEPADPKWNAEVRQEIALALRSEKLLRSKLVSADCQATLCRVSLSHASEEAREDFLDVLPTTRPFSTEGFVRTMDRDGSPSTVVYFARQGHPLND